jgi:hypothetical protein
MYTHFVAKEEAPLRELIELCGVALSLIHERRQLLKLLRANPAGEERDTTFNTALKRLQYLEGISHEVQLGFRSLASVKCSEGRVEAVRERKLRALFSHRPSAVSQHRARTIVYSDSEAAPHNSPREKPDPKARTVSSETPSP